MASRYAGISVTPEARDELQRFAASAGGALGRRVTLADALRLALAIATPHLPTDAEPVGRALGLVVDPDPNGDE